MKSNKKNMTPILIKGYTMQDKMRLLLSKAWRLALLSLFILSSELSFADTGMQVVKSGADFNTGLFEEETVDLKVKTLGGYVKLRRHLVGGVWKMNPSWSDLQLVFKADDESMLPSQIVRDNRFDYEKRGSSSNPTYVFKNNKFIIKTDSGYRWKDRFGNWIDYNDEGVMLSYGDRNTVVAYITRDSDGRISAVENYNHDILFTYSYNDKNLLAFVEDFTGRKVFYEYDSSNKLITFKDSANIQWDYTYHNEYPNLVGQRKGSNDETVTIDYYKPQSKTCIEGGGSSWSFSEETQTWSRVLLGCSKVIIIESPITLRNIVRNNKLPNRYSFFHDKAKKQWTILTNYPDKSMSALTYNDDGDIVARVRNGRQVEATSIVGTTHTVADENKNKTIIRYDSFDNPLEITYPDGAKTTRTYNSEYSSLTLNTDENGNITKYEYDSNGNLLTMTEAQGKPEQIITTYAYDQYGQGTQINYADGSVEKWTYDNKGNVATYTDGENHTTIYSNFDALGNPRNITDPRGNTTEMQYDNAGNLTQYKTALGYIAKYEYDGRGNLTKIIDAKNQVTLIAYDGRNRISQVTDPLANKTQYRYNYRGQVTLITDATNKVTQIEYDLDGNITKVIDGNNNVTGTDYGYLNLKPYKSLVNQINYPSYSSHFEYDTRNRPTRITDKTTGSDDRQTQYRYDNAGNTTKITDPRGNVSNLTYDAHNRIVKFADRSQQNTQYQYDSNHNLSKVINAKNNDIRRYEYDHKDQLTKEILPDNTEYTLSYDANGNTTRQVDAKGQVSQYEYDADNRLVTSRTFINVAQADDIANYATNAQKTTQYSYDAIDQLISYDDGTSQGSYIYDADSRLIEYTVNYGSFSKTAKYSYYPNGKKKSYTSPDGQITSYYYDGNNQLQRVSIPGQGSITVNENNWLAPKIITYPGGIKQNISHDGYLRTQQIKTDKADNSALLNHQYEYDAYDNLTLQTILAGSRMGPSNYEYDKEDRLTQYTIPAFNTQSASTIGFSYDGVGNRLTDNRDANPNTWEYDNRDRLKKRGKLNYAYDDNGSLISITHTDSGLQKSFVYNLDNRLTEVKDGAGSTIATYQYDPFGRRTSKTSSGTTTYFFYSQEGLVAEMDSAGSIQTQYGYRPHGTWGTNPLFIKQGGYTGYYQNDQLGTPQQIVTASGQVIWDAHYSAFGKATVTTSVITNNLRLAGQYYDQETSLHYNYFRYYDPEIGRYLRSDPIGLSGGINAYSYANSNPLVSIDPLGLFALPSLPQGLVDFSAGFGDTLSFGLTDTIRDWMDTNGSVNKCSDAYGYGEGAGVGASLAFGGVYAGRYAMNVGAKTFFRDGRKYGTIQRLWSKTVGGYRGKYELHHWYTPQSLGGTSAGWNLVAISPKLNNMMGNGGMLFNTFKGAFIGTNIAYAGAIPTAIKSQINKDCSCSN